jgi:ferredoxin
VGTEALLDLDTDRWKIFLKRRTALEKTLHLSACNGCDHCGERCTSGFGVTVEEWEAVKSYLTHLPQEERSQLSQQQRTLPWPGAEETGATVTYCQFRDMGRGRCSIYPVRPTICRLFGVVHWLPCPIEAVTHYPEDAVGVWNTYREEKRKTWEQWQEEESLSEKSNK